MGIPLVSYCVAVPRPLFLLVKFLNKIRVAILVVVSYLFLCFLPGRNNNRSHRLQASVREPPPPPSTIKEQLPVTEFMSISHKLQDQRKCQSEAKHLCIVCLENLEQSDQVRVLGSCVHAFHRECIDQWIDVGQAICPLCRAQLLPRKHKGISMLLRIFS
ncbi:E3 ubiquitin-protein ligase RHA1B-like protein [Carex littledalei]|uniref:E3 ubiquitin-protein ligase RHA1B-like protein n=1 Tax=Carex littledalei TaxID=544730 RepID=A0A833RFZ0_9POAL|nr:E3 ubiquitin-protein ligase RHA1B-like protein [Carex littledalei]